MAQQLNVVLEFSASVGDKLLKGADFVRFDEEVMIRPLDALQALGQETRRRLGHRLADHKVNL